MISGTDSKGALLSLILHVVILLLLLGLNSQGVSRS